MRATASAIAREGSAGVEKTLRIRRVLPSTQMQSVNVPPLSMAIRKGPLDTAGRGRMSGGAAGGLFSTGFADSGDLEGVAGEGAKKNFFCSLFFFLGVVARRKIAPGPPTR